MPTIESKKRNSILGSIALLAGFGAVALSAIDVPGLPSVNVGRWTLPFALALDLGVGALAIVSLLLAAKSLRTGTELPGAALAVAIAAGGIFYFRHRTPPAPPSRPTPTAAPGVATPAPPKAIVKAPAHPAVAPSVSDATTAAKNATRQSAAAAAALARQQQLAALQDAKAQFAQEQARVLTALKADPTYQQAKARNDAADLQLRDARLSFRAGDPNLVATSQTALAARDALNQFVANAIANDPAAAAAKARLDALMQNQH